MNIKKAYHDSVNKLKLDDKVVDTVKHECKIENTVVQPKKKNKFLAYAMSGIFAMASVVIIIVSVLFAGGNKVIAPSFVMISFNPQVEFTVKGDQVTAQKSLNKDGAVLLLKKNYVGTKIEIVVNSMLKDAQKLNLIKDHEINVYTQNNLQKEEDTLKEKVVSSVQSFLTTNNLQNTIESEVTAEIESLAKKYNISEAKMKLAKKIADETKQNINELVALEFEDLVELSASYNKADIDAFEAELELKFDKMEEDFEKTFSKNIKIKEFNDVIAMLENCIEEVDKLKELSSEAERLIAQNVIKTSITTAMAIHSLILGDAFDITNLDKYFEDNDAFIVYIEGVKESTEKKLDLLNETMENEFEKMLEELKEKLILENI